MRILIGNNGTAFANAAIDSLDRAGLPEDAEVTVITIAELCFPTVVRSEAAGIAESTAARLHKMFPGWRLTTRTEMGAAAPGILSWADSFRPDLIIIGEKANGPGEKNLFLGPVSQRIITDSDCSIHIARGTRGPRRSRPVRLVVGFDGSPGSIKAVGAVASRSWPAGTQVRLMSVADSSVVSTIGRFTPLISNGSVEIKYARQWTETVAACPLDALRAAGLDADLEVRTGDARNELASLAADWDADCLFVGPHCAGNSFERFLLGSVSAAVAARADCSVEIVRR